MKHPESGVVDRDLRGGHIAILPRRRSSSAPRCRHAGPTCTWASRSTPRVTIAPRWTLRANRARTFRLSGRN